MHWQDTFDCICKACMAWCLTDKVSQAQSIFRANSDNAGSGGEAQPQSCFSNRALPDSLSLAPGPALQFPSSRELVLSNLPRGVIQGSNVIFNVARLDGSTMEASAVKGLQISVTFNDTAVFFASQPSSDGNISFKVRHMNATAHDAKDDQNAFEQAVSEPKYPFSWKGSEATTSFSKSCYFWGIFWCSNFYVRRSVWLAIVLLYHNAFESWSLLHGSTCLSSWSWLKGNNYRGCYT